MNFLIDQQEQLNELEATINELRSKAVDSNEIAIIAVDTEFLREKTYNAKLCLVQLGINEHQYCIDVLNIRDLTLLKNLLADEAILKLFHAARQDMEVIYQTLDVIPKPIFDTQLAAAFCGMDMQIGYGAIVSNKLNVELPKTQSRTDWTKRPLSSEQVEYAGDDVAYLESLYELLLEELQSVDRYEWFIEELDAYYDPLLYKVDPKLAYQRLSGGALNVEQQYLLKVLAQWREETAQQRNIPRTWVIKDDRLYDLAIQRPKTSNEVAKMGVFGKKSVKYWAPEIMTVIDNVKVEDKRLWNRVEPLTKAQKSVCNKMMQQLKTHSEEYNISQGLLGTRRDIEGLFRYRKSKKMLQGWRNDLIGVSLLELIE